MAQTYQLVYGFNYGGEQLSRTVTVSNEMSTAIDRSVADSTTDLEVALEIDVSLLKALWIESDQVVTIETNSGSAPDHAFVMVANQPLVWQAADYHANPFDTTDITSIFITNASGATANVKIRVLADATA